MGLTTNVLGRAINPAAAWSFRLGKLSLRLFHIGPRPVLLAETLGLFGVYHLVSAKAWYACMATRMVLRNRNAAKDAERALDVLQLDESRIVDHSKVAAAIKLASLDSKLRRQQAGLIFADELMGRVSKGDKAVAAKFACAGAPFCVRAALVAFYGTLASRKMADALAKPSGSYERVGVTVNPGGAISVAVVDDTYARVLLPLVDEAWAEMNNRLVRDAVDLFLL